MWNDVPERLQRIPAKKVWYNGEIYNSALEAKWAVFFDTMGIEYKHEPREYMPETGVRYLPDFALFNVKWRGEKPQFLNSGRHVVFVEVKGANSYDELDIKEKVKIEEFAQNWPLLVLGNLPEDSNYFNKNWDRSDKLMNFCFLDGKDEDCFFIEDSNKQIWLWNPILSYTNQEDF